VNQKVQCLLTETPQLSAEESPVTSIPVQESKKLVASVTEYVGDFSLIPTSATEHFKNIGTTHNGIRERGIHTKSANRGWRMVAKW